MSNRTVTPQRTALYRFYDAGGVLLVTPGAATAAQAWTDGFTEAFAPAFSIGRDVTNLEPAQGLVFDAASRPAWDPLKGLVAEAAELVKPVRVSKVLGLTLPDSTEPLPWSVSS
jgi:hypothetical protein